VTRSAFSTVGPPGPGQRDLAYVESTASVTAPSSGNILLIAAPAITFDGVMKAIIEFTAPYFSPPFAAGVAATVQLYQDATGLDYLGNIRSSAAGAAGTVMTAPTVLKRTLTPPAGSHAYSLYLAGNGASMGAGAGTGGTYAPMSLRISTPTTGTAPIRTTASPISGGPPAAPSDGDIWIAYNVDANGTVWQFRYNAGSSSAYKWEFIGGPSARVAILTNENTTTTGAWVDLATVGPSFVVARGGDYLCEYFMDSSHTITNGKMQAGISVGATAAVDNGGVYGPVATGFNSVARKSLVTGVAASGELRVRYYNLLAGTLSALNRQLYVTPVRIS
jgi:hypothetical protein